MTYNRQVACTYKQPSVPHVVLQEATHFRYKMRHIWVTKSMDAATAGDHWSRCRHRLQLKLPLPLSLIPFGSSHSQWICNDCTCLWIRDGDRQVSKLLRGVEVLAMPDAGLDTTWRVQSVCEVSLGAGELRPLLPSVVVGEFIDRCCVDDRVDATS